MKGIVNFDEEIKPKRKINKRKLSIVIAIVAIVAIIGITMIAYSSDKSVRNFLDTYLFRKNISEENLKSIPLDYNSNVNVLVYNKNIGILADNKLMQYSASGEYISEIPVEISNPIYDVNNRYLVLSEKNSSKIYLISGSKIKWEKEVDGNISKLNVNENGYVSAILSGTTYKSVIVTFDNNGKELFKTYLGTTTAMSTSISNNNEYLAFAEINTSGTLIQSNIKIISIEKASIKETGATSATESIIYTYKAPTGSIVTNIKYNDKTKLICMYDDSIHCIENGQDTVIMNLKEDGKKISAADIKLKNNIYRAVEKSTSLFTADTTIEIMNIDSKNESIYTIEGVAKSINSYENTIAINLGQEVEFINTSGWLMKRYKSSQDVQKIIIGNGIAGIVYQNKVEIINL